MTFDFHESALRGLSSGWGQKVWSSERTLAIAEFERRYRGGPLTRTSALITVSLATQRCGAGSGASLQRSSWLVQRREEKKEGPLLAITEPSWLIGTNAAALTALVAVLWRIRGQETLTPVAVELRSADSGSSGPLFLLLLAIVRELARRD